MQKFTSKKRHIWTIVALSLIVTILGLAGLSPTRPTAYAQSTESTLFLPLIFKNAAYRLEESIMILAPGPGSHVTSPIQVSGVSDPTFEQHLAGRVLQADGTLVSEASTTIQADSGQRGPFTLDLPVNLLNDQNIFIQVFATSPRDGGVTHLSSVGVVFSPNGPENIITREPYPEQIAIIQPKPGATITGGSVHVAGFGLAGFEQTLLVEVLDENGNVAGSQPVIVSSPNLGEPGPFEADIPYTVSAAGLGRIVVRDVSPAFGGDVHRSSVEVNLSP